METNILCKIVSKGLVLIILCVITIIFIVLIRHDTLEFVVYQYAKLTKSIFCPNQRHILRACAVVSLLKLFRVYAKCIWLYCMQDIVARAMHSASRRPSAARDDRVYCIPLVR